MRTYKFFNHQDKGNLYRNALDKRWMRVERPPIYFTFADQAIFGRVQTLENLKAKKHFLYPHAGRPSLSADFMPMWNEITAEFVATDRHEQVMRIFGHDKPIYVVGWHLCKIREFQSKKNVQNVLFAPIHPRCDIMDQDLNRKVFNMLQALDIQLTVRYVGELKDNGLDYVEKENVHFFNGNNLKPCIEQIDEADVVVAHQTFAYLAVARGIPTVMFGEDMVPHLIPRGKPIIFPKHWNEYHHLIRYPLDIEDGNPMDILQACTKQNSEVDEWKLRMIGNPFDEDMLLRKVENHL